MKLLNVVLTGLLISGLLIGCTEEGETKGEQVKTEKTTIKQVAAVNPSKIWNDVSTPEGFNNYEIEPTLEAWIAYHAQDINKTTDVDEYYLRADRLTKEMIYFRVQGEDLKRILKI
ncbi:hypothetical protein U2I53_04415 [Lysinibacillus capsici]|uniref:hypothetical protein n=1 Tax=Lysinibacillus capsici TaxID=2115968 RepID=UPI0032DEF514